jgi:hypothetical protein
MGNEMPEVCARVDGAMECMAVDPTEFTDPRQHEVTESPGEAGGPVEVPGLAVVRTEVPWGAVPDGWPRGQRIPGELVKGQERVPCELVVRAVAGESGSGGAELLLIGEDVFRSLLGRAP